MVVEVKGGTFFNLNTGEPIKILSLDLSDCTVSETTEDYRLSCRRGGTISFNEEINGELMKQFKGLMPEAYDIYIQVPIQRRQHKKKRINKKWAKRYGYVTKTITEKGWKIYRDADGNIELIKDSFSKEEFDNLKLRVNQQKSCSNIEVTQN